MASQDTLIALQETIRSRKEKNPKESYVASLFAVGKDKILKKVIEEAGEVLMASKDSQHQEEENSHLVYEVADLLFHCMVLLVYHNSGIEAVLAELHRREDISGLTEKATRSSR